MGGLWPPQPLDIRFHHRYPLSDVLAFTNRVTSGFSVVGVLLSFANSGSIRLPRILVTLTGRLARWGVSPGVHFWRDYVVLLQDCWCFTTLGVCWCFRIWVFVDASGFGRWLSSCFRGGCIQPSGRQYGSLLRMQRVFVWPGYSGCRIWGYSWECH